MACWDPSRSLEFWRHKSPISSGLPRWHQWQKTCLPKQEMQETLVWSLGRSPGIGNGKLLQYSCLDNPGDRRAHQGYSPWDCKEWDTTEWLSVHACAHTHSHLHAWPCNKAFSAPNTDISVCLTSPCLGHMNLCSMGKSLQFCQYFHVFYLSPCFVETLLSWFLRFAMSLFALSPGVFHKQGDDSNCLTMLVPTADLGLYILMSFLQCFLTF